MLARILAESAHPGFDIVRVPGVNPFLQTCKTGSTQEIPTIEETVSTEVLRIVVGWVGRRAE